MQDVEKLIRAGLRNPVLVSVKEKISLNDGDNVDNTEGDERTPSTLANRYIVVEEPERKFETLVAFLRDRPM